MTLQNSFQSLYDKYADMIYGMIRCCVEEEPIAANLLQKIFLQLKERSLAVAGEIAFKDIIVMVKTTTAEFLQQYKTPFKPHSWLEDIANLTNEKLLQLVYFGRYSISELAVLLSISEADARKIIVTAIKSCRQSQPALLNPAV